MSIRLGKEFDQGVTELFDRAITELRRPIPSLFNCFQRRSDVPEHFAFDRGSEDGSRTAISIQQVESPGRFIEIGTIVHSEIQAQLQATPLSPNVQERIRQLRDCLENTVWNIPLSGTRTGRLSTFVPPYHDFKRREEPRGEPLDNPNPALPKYRPR